MVKLNSSTKSHAFYSGGVIIFVRKNYATDFLSVMMLTGCGDPQKVRPNSLNARYIAKNSLAQMDFLTCEGVNVLEPYATGA